MRDSNVNLCEWSGVDEEVEDEQPVGSDGGKVCREAAAAAR